MPLQQHFAPMLLRWLPLAQGNRLMQSCASISTQPTHHPVQPGAVLGGARGGRVLQGAGGRAGHAWKGCLEEGAGAGHARAGKQPSCQATRTMNHKVWHTAAGAGVVRTLASAGVQAC